MRLVGYGICGSGEADRYLRGTLDEFKRLCDETIICGVRIGEKERSLIREYGFHLYEIDEEWGKSQNKIKESFLKNEVAKLKPDACVCLDMDEVFDPLFTRKDLEEWLKISHGLYFYFVQMWDKGIRESLNFWNVRAFQWKEDISFKSQPLHCGLAPEYAYFYGNYAPFFVKHYGMMKKEDRQKKVDRYKQYDPEAKYKEKSYYDTLSSDLPAETLDDEKIRQSISEFVNFKQKLKTIPKMKEDKFFYVKTPSGSIVDIPELHLTETLARPGFELVGEVRNVKEEIIHEVVGKAESLKSSVPEYIEPNVYDPIKDAPEANFEANRGTFNCDCGYEAKSKAGLSAHQRKCQKS